MPLDVKKMPTKISAMIGNLAVYLGHCVFAGGMAIQIIACASGTRVYTIPAGTDLVKPVALGSYEYGPILDAIVSVMVRDLNLPAPIGSVTVYPSQVSYEEGAIAEAREELERLRQQLGPKADQLKEEDFLFGAKRAAVGSAAHARYKKVLVNEWLLRKSFWADQLRLLAHELTHVMQMDLVEGRSITADQWVREGLADWVGYKVAEVLGAESFNKGRERALDLIAERKYYQTFPSLSQLALNSEWLTWSRTLGNSGTYGQAFIAVDFLITEKGLPAVINYFQFFKKLNNRGRNFATAFGEPVSTFEERFAKHLDHQLRK
jgi:hypothetical protein